MRKRSLHCRAAARHCLGLGLLIGTVTLMAGVQLFSINAHAQAYNGAIVGTVTDSGGASIPNVTVTAINTGTNNKYTATTSGSGSYSIAQLPVGIYVVHAEAANFKEAVINNVEVHGSTNAEVNVVLQVGTASEKVTVSRHCAGTDHFRAVGEVIVAPRSANFR